MEKNIMNSTFTEFYQAYILFKKFKIDKRRPHISCLIRKVKSQEMMHCKS